jgi:CheY-like chemotaxis protein
MNESTEGAKLRVLVVDDNVDGADALSAVLQAFDCVTSVAYNGFEALAAAATFNPHLAIIDLEMPGINGREVVRRLRAEPATRGMRLVCLTGRALPDDRRLCLEAGFDEFVTKPIEQQAIVAMVAMAKARLEE